MKYMTIYTRENRLRFSLYNTVDQTIIANGLFERIGMDASRYVIRFGDEQIIEEIEISSYDEVGSILLDKLISLNIIEQYSDIDAIGYKIDFGGEYYKNPVFISGDVITKLEEMSEIIPMKSTLDVISSFSKTFIGVDMIGLFDTSFYSNMDEVSYLYGVPYSWYKNYGVRRYGYYGLHHQFIDKEVRRIIGREHLKVISCYLDNESSISAVIDGKCIDTSMGFTSLTGLLMGTKCGDVDPSIIPYIMEKEGKNVGEVLYDLNHSSGLLGISGSSSDMRDIMALSDDDHPEVVLAKEMYIRKVVEYIAKYYVLLNKADVLVFSGMIGEANRNIREEICNRLGSLGIELDFNKNINPLKNKKINSDKSSISIMVISSNEELEMIREMDKLRNR